MPEAQSDVTRQPSAGGKCVQVGERQAGQEQKSSWGGMGNTSKKIGRGCVRKDLSPNPSVWNFMALGTNSFEPESIQLGA